MSSRKKQVPARMPAAPPPPVKFSVKTSLALGLLFGGAIGVAAAAFFYFRSPRVVDMGVVSASTVHADPGAAPKVGDKDLFATYAGSASCRACHPKESDAWATSHHALAERPVDLAKDRAAFDPPRSFAHGTQRTEVKLDGETCLIASPGAGGNATPLPVARVIGESPLRQFLVAFPGGRFQTMEASYDPLKNQWFDVYGDEDRKAGEWGHWTGRGMNWNSQCAACHNTRVRKNYDEGADAYRTAMAEATVSCEACHGPMKRHLEEAKTLAAEAASPRKPGAATRPYSPARFSKEQVFHTCASCHARRADLTGEFAPGDNFFDHYSLAVPDLTELFYPDGQVKEEDYEFTAFSGSKMHAAGVRCADCHEPHTGKTLLAGNNLCMRCHNGSYQGSPLIVPEQHSFHKAESAGNQCVNCHMPQTTYMQRHARHDHGFTTPDPLLTKEHGVPNACNRCHTDKDANWAIDATDKWYGAKMQRPTRDRARTIAKARRGDEDARPAALKMLAEEKQPFWRAVAAAVLAQWADDPRHVEVSNALMAALDHADPLVRESAATSLSSLAQRRDRVVQEALENRLTDPVRAVRVRAAWALRENLSPTSAAGQDLVEQLKYGADQPAGAKARGDYLAFRDLEAATQWYTRAVDWDPNTAALRDALANALVLGQHTQSAAEQYALAAKLDPRQPTYPYKLALAYDKLQKYPQAIDILRQAEAAFPNNAQFPYVRALIHQKANQTDEAKRAARRALELNPAFDDAKALLQSLE